MKRNIALLLVFMLLLSLTACDLSSAKSQADVKLKDLKISAVSPENITVYSREAKFELKVEPDQSTIYGDTLYYTWYVYVWGGDSFPDSYYTASKNPNADGHLNTWNDVAFFRPEKGDLSTYKWNYSVFNETWPTATYQDGSTTGLLFEGSPMGEGMHFKITCVAVNPFEATTDKDRKESCSVDFFVTLEDPDPSQGKEVFEIIALGEDVAETETWVDNTNTRHYQGPTFRVTTAEARGDVTFKWYYTTVGEDAFKIDGHVLKNNMYFPIDYRGEGNTFTYTGDIDFGREVNYICVAFDGTYYAYHYFKVLDPSYK